MLDTLAVVLILFVPIWSCIFYMLYREIKRTNPGDNNKLISYEMIDTNHNTNNSYHIQNNY